MTPRRLHFQLTPLLDLLLIVIFAQYMDVQETTEKQEQVVSSKMTDAEQQLESTQAELEELNREKQLAADDLKNLQTEFADAQHAASSLQQERNELKAALERAQEQRDTIAGLMPQLFDLPEETVQELIRTRTPENVRLTPDQVKRLRDEFREFAQKNPNEAVRHLLTFEEMRKRCDIWEVYVGSNGMTTFLAGEKSQKFRTSDADGFAQELFDRYKSLPQPKSLVILLLSFGDVKASVHIAAVDGLPKAAERMRNDQSGRSRFEYAVLGYNPTPPNGAR